jgi:hypothetical protein
MKILSLAMIILFLVFTFGIRPVLTDENPTDREKCENFAIEMKVSEIDTTEFTENCISHLKTSDTDENPTDREKCENFAIEMEVGEIDTNEFIENCISHLKACDLVTCDDFSFLDNTDTSNDEVINDAVLLNE